MPVIMSTEIDSLTGEKNPFESLKTVIATDVKDWSTDKRNAWIYGIVLGWSDFDDPESPEESAMEELREQFGWTDADVARLKWLHQEFERINKLYETI